MDECTVLSSVLRVFALLSIFCLHVTGSIQQRNVCDLMPPPGSKRLICRVAYDGSAFHGFQFLNDKRTVQWEIERALDEEFVFASLRKEAHIATDVKDIHEKNGGDVLTTTFIPDRGYGYEQSRGKGGPSTFQRGSIPIVASSRTDRGVHARGNLLHFDVNPTISHQLGWNDMNQEDVNDMLSSTCCRINHFLPNDVKIFNLQLAPPGSLPEQQGPQGLPFHAIENAIGKHYSYRFSTNPVFVDPLQRLYCANVWSVERSTLPPFLVPPPPAHCKTFFPPHMTQTLTSPDLKLKSKIFPEDPYIDINLFQEALSLFIGTHDFAAFGNQLDKRAAVSFAYSGIPFDSVRTIYNATVEQETPGVYRVDIFLSGALFMMVRNIIEACLAVSVKNTVKYQRDFARKDGGVTEEMIARGYLNDISRLLGRKQEALVNGDCGKSVYTRRDNKFTTAPGCGLCLEKVFFKEID